MAQPSSALDFKQGPLDPAQAAAVSQAVDGLNVTQLTWVSGYLAGLAATAGATSPAQAASAPAALAAPSPTLTVLFGSQTGNGQAIAQELARVAAEQGMPVELKAMQDYRPASLKRESYLLVVVSTHGEGEPPDEAAGLHEYLGSARAPRLDHLHFAVLALGDSSYEHFCQTGKDFDERLAALGATRLGDRVDCDVDYESPAEAWREAMLAQVQDALSAQATESAARPAVHLHAVTSAPRHDKRNPYDATLLANQPITGRGSGWPVRHLEFSLEGSGLSYEPGDALGVLPHNPRPLVAQLMDRLQAGGDEPVALGDGEVLSLREALTSRFEVTVLSRSFVERYAAVSESRALNELLAGDRSTYSAWAGQRQVIDVLREFPVTLSPGQFAGMLRKLTPRLYSIASSPLATPDEVHLTVAEVRYEKFGEPHWGAASTYLADAVAEGDTAPVYVQPNNRFRLPADGDTPVIMIGPGTGVAPFRAFVEHRQALGANGRNWLFFGARQFDTDFLYQIEWLRHLRQGGLSKLDVAFSRDQREKIYVQDRLQEHGADLYAWLEEGAHVYVCGDASRMAVDVDETLRRIVATHGARDDDQASDYLAQLRDSGRYQRDVY
ncbi:MAG: assimilatory sulfite reductase (NADPH) flavoprotein subunit [Pseudomonadota bacterium]